MKPLVLGTSMDSHTQKLSPGNWTTKFFFDIQAVNAFFLSSSSLGQNHPPIWDWVYKYFSGFSSIFLISTRQMAVQGSQVFLWAFIHICSSQQGRWQSRESFADQLHHILIIFQGLTNNARCRASPCRPRIVCRFLVTNDSNL